MKILLKILVFLIIFYSCEEDGSTEVIDYSSNKLVEEFTFDQYGVLFKIINDYNSDSDYSFDFDSVALSKFHYEIKYNVSGTTINNDIHNKEHFTWIPYGYYVNWRYNYTDEKQVVIVTNINNEGNYYLGFIKEYSCNPAEVDAEWFQELFPYSSNDTVYVSISKLIEDIKYNTTQGII